MSVSQIIHANDQATLAEFVENAKNASQFLKTLSHESRLLILCHLSSGEKSVSELESLIAVRQAAVSQQLARLRLEGFVSTRREGKTIYYSLLDTRVIQILDVVSDIFCPPHDKG